MSTSISWSVRAEATRDTIAWECAGSRIKFGRKKESDDIYRWAKEKIEDAYDRNLELKQLYETGGSIRNGKGREIRQAVVQDVAQNIAD